MVRGPVQLMLPRMKSMHRLLLLILVGVVSLSAQTIFSKRIKGMRVTGMADAKFPMTLVDSYPVTITFDVDAPHSENFRVKFFHCDRDWNVTQSSFINDEFRNYSRNQIPSTSAPAGVQQYRWTYTLRIPGQKDQNSPSGRPVDFERLPQSGNYKFEVWSDSDQPDELLAEGKFFAVEKIEDSALTIENRSLPSEISPLNQVNKAVLSVIIPSPGAGDANPLYPASVKTVDVYRNREIERPYRIDLDDRETSTYLEGVGTNSLKFVIDNLQPGNEYRRLDLRNSDLYPPGELLRLRHGADQSRWLWQGAMDYFGTSVLVSGSRYAEYVSFQFELGLPEEKSNEIIYVVGDFNGWKIDDRWRLQYDPSLHHYTLVTQLRRGAYDYQYVLNGTDWGALEGNDWRTVNMYTALLYYHDPRYGGFDRILLGAQKKSPGGTASTSR